MRLRSVRTRAAVAFGAKRDSRVYLSRTCSGSYDMCVSTLDRGLGNRRRPGPAPNAGYELRDPMTVVATSSPAISLR